jgi:hypothetical protein
MTAKFTNISQLNKALNKIDRRLPAPPYHPHFSIDRDGTLVILNDTALVPCEVARLVRWLIEFYEIEV